MAWTSPYVRANTSATDRPMSVVRHTSSPNTSPSPKIGYETCSRNLRLHGGGESGLNMNLHSNVTRPLAMHCSTEAVQTLSGCSPYLQVQRLFLSAWFQKSQTPQRKVYPTFLPREWFVHLEPRDELQNYEQSLEGRHLIVHQKLGYCRLHSYSDGYKCLIVNL